MNRIDRTDALRNAHAEVTAAQSRLLSVVADCDRDEMWEPDGARDFVQWLSGQLGISNWAARRWANAARRLPHLPCIRAALEAGTICFDKALELCRFATGETEAKLLKWAQRVTLAAVRHRANVEVKTAPDEVVENDRTRYLRYQWEDEGKRLGLWGSFPAAQGHRLIKGLEGMAASLPVITTFESDSDYPPRPEDIVETRLADALLVLVESRGGLSDTLPPADFVVHADITALNGDGNCEIEGGPGIPSETARRLSCDARLRPVLHDPSGRTIGIGRSSRVVPDWLLTQLKHRDRGCTFPGCESKRFLHAHHIVHWARGGRTDMDNLALVCTFHHKLVHEYRWGVRLDSSGAPEWFDPGGRRFDPFSELPARASPRADASSPRAEPTCRSLSRLHSPTLLPSP